MLSQMHNGTPSITCCWVAQTSAAKLNRKDTPIFQIARQFELDNLYPPHLEITKENGTGPLTQRIFHDKLDSTKKQNNEE